MWWGRNVYSQSLPHCRIGVGMTSCLLLFPKDFCLPPLHLQLSERKRNRSCALHRDTSRAQGISTTSIALTKRICILRITSISLNWIDLYVMTQRMELGVSWRSPMLQTPKWSIIFEFNKINFPYLNPYNFGQIRPMVDHESWIFTIQMEQCIYSVKHIESDKFSSQVIVQVFTWVKQFQRQTPNCVINQQHCQWQDYSIEKNGFAQCRVW